MRLELGFLETRGLVRVTQTEPEKEYKFKHSLVKEAAYRTLLREERQHLHGLTGKTLERLFPNQRAELAPNLGHHYERAGDHEKAFEYWIMSGDRAMRVHAYEEAQSFFERAMGCLDQFADAPSEALRETFELQGRALELAGEHEQALARYRELERRGQERGERSLELAGKVSEATLYCTPSPLVDRKKGIALSEQTLSMAQDLGDMRSEIRSRWNLVLALALMPGREPEAIEQGEKALDLARKEGAEDLRAFLCNDVGRTHLFCGNMERADELLDQAEQLWRANENIPMLVDCLVTRVGMKVQKGELEDMLPLWEQADRLAVETENDWASAYSRIFLAAYYLHRGEYGRCLELGQAAVDESRASGFDVFSALTLSHLSELYIELNALDLALEAAEVSIAEMKRLFHNWLPIPLALKAKVLLLRGSPGEAYSLLADFEAPYAGSEMCFAMTHVPATVTQAQVELEHGRPQKALEIARQLGDELVRRDMRLYLPDVRLTEGKAFEAIQQDQKALEAFKRGQAVAEETGAQRILWQLLVARAKAEERLGQTEEADRRSQRAANVVNELSESLGGTGHQRSFMARSDVRSLLEAQ